MITHKGLFDKLVEEIPYAFAHEILKVIRISYDKAMSSSFAEEGINAELKPYAFGHNRHFFMQSAFHDLGEAVNLRTEIYNCKSNNYPIYIIHTNSFHFTLHHAPSWDKIESMQPSIIRRQKAGVNLQYLLFGPDAGIKVDRIGADTSIYINFIELCEDRSFAGNGSLKIVVPYPEKVNGVERLKFAEIYDFADLLSALDERERVNEALLPLKDRAIPKIRKEIL